MNHNVIGILILVQARKDAVMFKVVGLGFAVAIAALAQTGPAAQVAHVWEKQEITLKAQNSYPNPYLAVDVWVDLAGPGFKKRGEGFLGREKNVRGGRGGDRT